MDEKQKEESKFRQVWGNKRHKAMIKLSGYILFFILVGVLIDFNPSDNPRIEESQDRKTISFSKYDNYEFYYNITYLGLVDEPVKYINIDGYRYQERRVFQVRDTLEKYYVENQKFYQVGDALTEVTQPFFLSFERISPEFLSKYMERAKLNSTTEYADKTIKKEYILSVSDFGKLYQDEEIETGGNVEIITYEKEKEIYRVELDLTAYNKMRFELNYKNVGKVESFYKEDILPMTNE